VQRAKFKGYTVLGITDHVDLSNLDLVVPQIAEFCEKINRIEKEIQVIPGAELTHLPPSLIPELASRAREKGAILVLVHGETILEPVPRGTNRAALDADIDILAHPGFISEEEVKIARERGLFLEISARSGHCLTNGHVAKLATSLGAELILNTDAHAAEDLITLEQTRKILLGTGLPALKITEIMENSQRLARKLSLKSS
jgi:histidinol phosphatase-like PHP family hydrolase